MGVHQLGVFVAKNAPAALLPFPTLAAFANRTFAIDGNLVTTKFHHTPSSPWEASRSQLPLEVFEQHRHARGWYRLFDALAREGIKPIVVFDGEARVPEKAQENIRRQAARTLQEQRGEAEKARGERLTAIRSTWEAVGGGDKDGVLQSFRETLEGTERTKVLEPKDEEALKMLVALHGEYTSDVANPIYSKNQVLVSSEETTFFENILQDDPLFVRDWDQGLGQLQTRSDTLGESHTKRALAVPQSAFIESIQLIKAMGIPFVQPSLEDPHEAEGLCATLYSLGLADYVVSEDTDVAVYGAPLIRRLTTQEVITPRKKKDGTDDAVAVDQGMHVLDPVLLREALSLTHGQFVDFSLLCGTDFTERIPLVGPVRALSYIRQWGTIEAVLSSQDKHLPPDPEAYLATIVAARTIFLSLPPLPPDASLEPTPPDPGLPAMLREWGITPVGAAGRKWRRASGSGSEARVNPAEIGGEDEVVVEEVVVEEVEVVERVERRVGKMDLEGEETRERRVMELAEAMADRM